jgi:hypothetical protein
MLKEKAQVQGCADRTPAPKNHRCFVSMLEKRGYLWYPLKAYKKEWQRSARGTGCWACAGLPERIEESHGEI